MYFYAFVAHAAPKALWFWLLGPSSVRPDVPCRIYFFRFARLLNGFRWNSWELINTTNGLNDYILGEIGTGKREQDTRQNLAQKHKIHKTQKVSLIQTNWFYLRKYVKHTTIKPKPKQLVICKNCSCVCTTVVYNAALNISDIFHLIVQIIISLYIRTHLI